MPENRPEIERPAKDRWLFSIDLLRGLAAFTVFVFHAEGMLWRRQPPIDIFDGRAAPFFDGRSITDIVSYLVCGFGFLGVPLFFIISGFCIHLPLAGKPDPLNPRSFAIRRFLRLYPLYFIVFAGVMALIKIKYHGTVKDEATLSNFLGHMVFWHYNVPPGSAYQGISPVLWSIAVEVQFYILYALLLPVLRKIGFSRGAIIFLALGLIYRIAYTTLNKGHTWPNQFDPEVFAPMRFGEWLLGAWVAEALIRGQLKDNPLRRIGLPLGFLLLGVSIAGVALLQVHRDWLDIPCCVAFTLILAGLLSREQSIGPQPMTPFRRAAKYLGDRSYSLYLVHFTVLNVAIEAASRLLHIQDKDSMGGTPPMLAAVLIGGVATFFVTEVTYRLIEAPSHRLARRLSGKRPA